MLKSLALEAMLSATILSLPLIESVQPVSLPLFFFLYSKLSPLAVRPGFLFGVMKSLNQTTPLNLKTLSQRVSNLFFCYNHLRASKRGVVSGSPPEDSEPKYFLLQLSNSAIIARRQLKAVCKEQVGLCSWFIHQKLVG